MLIAEVSTARRTFRNRVPQAVELSIPSLAVGTPRHPLLPLFIYPTVSTLIERRSVHRELERHWLA
jgi:hypothetical protein